MKRLLAITLAVLLGSFLVVGCSERADREKHAIEATYSYLIDRAEQLQNTRAQIQMGTIHWQFYLSVSDALRETALGSESLGDSIDVSLPERDRSSAEVPASTNALKKLVKYDKDGVWLVSIRNWEWQFNEKTGAIVAKNSEAAKLVDAITLRTYHNTKYGYSIDYPPDWNVLDIVKEAVNISHVSSDGTMETAIYLLCLPKIPNLGLRDYAERRVDSFQPDTFQIYTAEGNQTLRGLVVDIVGLRFENLAILGNNISYDAKWYFLDVGDNYFEILTVARPTAVKSLTNMFDPYTSLRFLR